MVWFNQKVTTFFLNENCTKLNPHIGETGTINKRSVINIVLNFLSIDKFITDGPFCVRGNIDDHRLSLRFAGHKMATQKIREDYQCKSS